MNRRSRYRHDNYCPHCGKPIADGRVALATTLYVHNARSGDPRFRNRYKDRQWVSNSGNVVDDVVVRVAYHRLCIEKILASGPQDLEIEKQMFEEYKEALIRRLEGMEADTNDD